MRFLARSLAGILLSAITLSLMAWAYTLISGAVQGRIASEPRTAPQRERVFAVNVTKAVVGTQSPVLEVFGEVESRRTLELRVATSGRVVFLAPNFEEGGAVRKGDVLLKTDPADAQAALARARADLSDAQADARDALEAAALARDELTAAQDQAGLRDSALQRQRDLVARGVGTAAAVETAELAASSARQSVLSRRQAVTQADLRIAQSQTRTARAELTVSDAERRLADTTLEAPFDGTLSQTTLVEGRLVNVNERVATLIDVAALEASFRLSTAQYARLLDSSGQLRSAQATVLLDVDGVDLTAAAELTRASAAVGETQTGRLVFARMAAAPGFIPGDFVTVRIQEPDVSEVVRLPASALDASGEVLVLGNDDRLEALPVQLVRRQINDILVRGAGLAGREVVNARSPLLGAGIKVKPLRGPTDAVPQAPEMLELTQERRAKLVAFIEGNTRMPAEAKARVLARLAEPKVPAQMVERIESRMGG